MELKDISVFLSRSDREEVSSEVMHVGIKNRHVKFLRKSLNRPTRIFLIQQKNVMIKIACSITLLGNWKLLFLIISNIQFCGISCQFFEKLSSFLCFNLCQCPHFLRLEISIWQEIPRIRTTKGLYINSVTHHTPPPSPPPCQHFKTKECH